MKKYVTFLLICFVAVLTIASISQAQKKITGPWLWMIAPTENGKNGVKAGAKCGKLNWTWGEIAATGDNNMIS